MTNVHYGLVTRGKISNENAPCVQTIMHQSIPAVPFPPPATRGNRGAFAHVVSPGGGAFTISSQLPGLGISIVKHDDAKCCL